LLAIAVGLLAWVAFWQEPRTLSVTAIDAQSPGWAAELAPIRVLFLSDLHVDGVHTNERRVRGIVSAANLMEPDIILLGGDYIGGLVAKSQYRWTSRGRRSQQGIARDEASLRALGALHARYGVFAVLGNHDCWWDCTRMRDILEADGINVLSNSATPVTRDDGSVFWVAGLADRQTQDPNFDQLEEQLPPNASVLLVMHNPQLFDLEQNRFRLQFAGHTHGGQVRFPLLGAPLRMSRHTEQAISGFMIERGRILIVSRGLGEVGLPVRFGAPPEIVLVRIQHGAEAHASTSSLVE